MGNSFNLTGRKPGLSQLGRIFGEGGYDHYTTITQKADNGETVVVKAPLKAADECGWQLDPQGLGIHCASTGRTRFIMGVIWLSLLIQIIAIIYELYSQGVFEGNTDNFKSERIIYIAIGAFISVLYLSHFYVMGLDRYHYGTTDFWLGTKTLTNTWSTADIDKGPLWESFHKTEYAKGVEDQAERIINNLKSKNPKLYASLMKNDKIPKTEKGKLDIISIEPVKETASSANKAMLRKEQLDVFRDKSRPEQSSSKFGEQAKLKGVTENPAKGLRGYSQAGYCDICAEVTGREKEDGTQSGDCNTIGRCILSIIIFSLFSIYFIGLGSWVLIDETDKSDETFRNVIVSLCFIMAVICGLSIWPMAWSAIYCPSGSEFVRETWLGYFHSFRW